jgi:hypothetical protein
VLYDSDSKFALSTQGPLRGDSFIDPDSYRHILAAFCRGVFDAKRQQRLVRPLPGYTSCITGAGMRRRLLRPARSAAYSRASAIHLTRRLRSGPGTSGCSAATKHMTRARRSGERTDPRPSHTWRWGPGRQKSAAPLVHRPRRQLRRAGIGRTCTSKHAFSPNRRPSTASPAAIRW